MSRMIRRFEEADARAVSDLVIRTLREVNSRDYSPEHIEMTVSQMQPEHIISRASWTHFYVAEEDGKIIGCGAIGPYWGRTDESSLFTVFVLPEYQKRGVGRQIIEKLEADEYFLRASRVEIPASVTACAFYERCGYGYKNGVREPDEEGLLRMEKHRNR